MPTTLIGRKSAALALGICADSVSNWVRRHKLHPRKRNARVWEFTKQDLSRAAGSKWAMGKL